MIGTSNHSMTATQDSDSTKVSKVSRLRKTYAKTKMNKTL